MKEKIKNILKTTNGVALVAVMFILLILTLFIPAMFNMSGDALNNSLYGTTIQRASYFARSITEMAVGAFTKTYDDIQEAKEGGTLDDAENAYLKTYSDFFDKFLEDKELSQKDEQYKQMSTGKVYIYYKDGVNGADGSYNYSLEKKDNDDTLGYYLGEGECIIKFDNTPHYYIVFTESMSSSELPAGCQTDKEGKDLTGAAGDIAEIRSDQYNTLATAIDTAISNSGTSGIKYTVTKTDNQQITFTTTATVKNKTKTRSCTIVIPTYPSKQGWLYFSGRGSTNTTTGVTTITQGCNQVQFDPAKKTGRAVINYSDAGIDDGDYASQPLQIYSCLGNMIINTEDVKDVDGNPINNGIDGSELVLGMNPQLSTTPDNDPTFEMINGINAATYANDVQRDNFIACTATNAIQVDVPINILINGLRGNRLGDGTAENQSIYKVLILQAPIIRFNRSVDMMVSLYSNSLKNANARRISTVTLMAPTNTPYSYYNETRKKTVKAGKVFFAEDCYLWVINYSDSGTAYSPAWWHTNETVWMRDKNFTKVKIASAGDVYYFNSEVELETKTTVKGFLGITKTVGSGNYVLSGLPLTAWALETYYYDNYYSLSTSNLAWWQIWKKAKDAVFGYYINHNILEDNTNRTYKDDDLHFIGNIYEGGDVEFPEVEGFYTVWSD